MKVYGPPLDNRIGPDGPEFPLLSQYIPRVVVPQPKYECGNTEKDWVPKPPILFFVLGCLGAKLSNARDGIFWGFYGGGKPPFDEAPRGITLRIHVGSYEHRASGNNSRFFQFPGYRSSTEVEKILKHSGRSKARSMQVRGVRNRGSCPMADKYTDSSQL
jgi:hypothetical protein